MQQATVNLFADMGAARDAGARLDYCFGFHRYLAPTSAIACRQT